MFEQKERLAKRKQLILFNLIQLINYGNGQERRGTRRSTARNATIQHRLSRTIHVHCSGQSPVEFNIFSLFSPFFCLLDTKSNTQLWGLGNWNRKSSERERENARERRGEKNEIQVQLCSMAQTERMDDNRHDLADIWNYHKCSLFPIVVVSVHWPQIYLCMNRFLQFVT